MNKRFTLVLLEPVKIINEIGSCDSIPRPQAL